MQRIIFKTAEFMIRILLCYNANSLFFLNMHLSMPCSLKIPCYLPKLVSAINICLNLEFLNSPYSFSWSLPFPFLFFLLKVLEQFIRLA